MTRNHRPPAIAPGDPAEYDTAAALAVNAARLADAVDDNRPDWLGIAVRVGDLLDALVIAKLDAAADWDAVFADIYTRAGTLRPAEVGLSLYNTAAELSATAADIAANITEARACPDLIGHARDLLGTLAAVLGEGCDRPPVVCLCGSTRFYDHFQQANYDLTMRGEIVLTVGFYPHAADRHGHGEGVGHDCAEKTALDELHKRKIDLADYVLVLNVGGYVGESTRSEIAYAAAHGKPVRYLESPERAA